MPSLKDIKKRIVSVKNTSQITKAMKMVSAAKLRKAQEAVVAARPYAEKVQDVISSLALREDADAHPLLGARGKNRALVVLMTSDRGLCGGFNSSITKTVEQFVRKNTEGYEAIDLMVVGRKGKELLKRRLGDSFVNVHENLSGNINYATAQLLGQEVVDGFVSETYGAVYLIYNAFKSAMTQIVTIDQLLPVVPKECDENTLVADYIYEPSQGDVLDQLLPKYVEVKIFKGLLESVASEHGSRMSAMDSASKNASEMIGKLTLQYNRLRQAAITKELMEIISGSESIKG
ncbi:MAG: ATP synthase F1 subunit gamma [Desulfuromonadales bacterium]|nr:ATP synthase F1 subunit gamma [Desulfuromonadales bacterium]